MPLTLTLSRGERELAQARLEQIRSLFAEDQQDVRQRRGANSKSAANDSPSPRGRGRGEGHCAIGISLGMPHPNLVLLLILQPIFAPTWAQIRTLPAGEILSRVRASFSGPK